MQGEKEVNASRSLGNTPIRRDPYFTIFFPFCPSVTNRSHILRWRPGISALVPPLVNLKVLNAALRNLNIPPKAREFSDYVTKRAPTLVKRTPTPNERSTTCVVFDFPEKPENSQSGLAEENAKEFPDISDFTLNISNGIHTSKRQSGFQQRKAKKAKMDEIQSMPGSLFKYVTKADSGQTSSKVPESPADESNDSHLEDSHSDSNIDRTESMKTTHYLDGTKINNENDTVNANFGDSISFEESVQHLRDVSHWSLHVPNNVRIDIIKKGSEHFQNKEGPFPTVSRHGSKIKAKHPLKDFQQRWSAHYGAVKVLAENFDGIISAIEELCDQEVNLETREALRLFIREKRLHLAEEAIDFAVQKSEQYNISMERRIRRKKCMPGELASSADDGLTLRAELQNDMLECLDRLNIELEKRVKSIKDVASLFEVVQSKTDFGKH
ncbi:hypothetical protein EVAR_22218_1 [Eumeta japonica]|uniref:Uncharacterized protein n=1 Tax=Eumeta variegata TaxID=151549 RepID=A0A4C1UB65_EUMVA|nr:hypothetical protein EVAR_22218_1 [Eumeta japonica]